MRVSPRGRWQATKLLILALFAAIAIILGDNTNSFASTVDWWGTYIGSNGIEPSPKPTPIAGLPSNISRIDASNSSDYALANGHVYAWGDNQYFQLGNGTKTASAKAIEVTVPAANSLGEAKNEGIAIDTHNNGWVWGQNKEGSLCTRKSPVKEPIKTTENVVAVQGAQNHTIWITTSGHVEGCGTNKLGELGLGSNISQTDSPVEIPSLEHIVEVSAGCHSSLARTSNGQVYAWGLNRYGEAGQGTETEAVYTPAKVPLPEAAVQISAGGDLENGADLAILADGQIYGWGQNGSGQADPYRDAKHILTPIPTGILANEAVTGGSNSFYRSTSILYGWGSATKYDLGTGSAKNQEPFPLLSNVKQTSATAANAIAVIEG